MVISWSKNGVFPTFWGEGKFFFLVSMVQMVHDTPLDLPKKQNLKIFIFKKVIKVPPPQNDKSSFCGPKMGQGVVPCHFSSKDFEILDLDSPNYPTSHQDACHFCYSLALNCYHIFWVKLALNHKCTSFPHGYSRDIQKRKALSY